MPRFALTQVVMVILSIAVLFAIDTVAFAAGRIMTIRTVEVRKTKKNGDSWDARRGEPDLRISVERKSDPKGEFYRTGVEKNATRAEFNRKSLEVEEGDELEIRVLDDDVTSDDEIGQLKTTITRRMIERGSAEFSFDQVIELKVTFD